MYAWLQLVAKMAVHVFIEGRGEEGTGRAMQGGTCVALYGLGNIRDERLARMFQTPGCVEWCSPFLSISPTVLDLAMHCPVANCLSGFRISSSVFRLGYLPELT